MRLGIIGTGGFAREVLQLAKQIQKTEGVWFNEINFVEIDDFFKDGYVEPENIPMIVSKAIEYSKLSKERLFDLGFNGYKYAKENFEREYLSMNYINSIKKIINE